MFTQTQIFPEGQNKITINQADSTHSGIYFYKIQTDEEVFSGKMILKQCVILIRGKKKDRIHMTSNVLVLN